MPRKLNFSPNAKFKFSPPACFKCDELRDIFVLLSCFRDNDLHLFLVERNARCMNIFLAICTSFTTVLGTFWLSLEKLLLLHPLGTLHFPITEKSFPKSKKRKQRRAPDKDPVVLVSCLARKLLQHFTSSAPVNFAPSSLISISCKSMETGGNLKLKIKIVGKVERRSAKVRRCKTHKVLLDWSSLCRDRRDSSFLFYVYFVLGPSQRCAMKSLWTSFC